MSQEQRIEELEARLTLADDQIDALNATVYRQQQEIDLLREQLLNLARQLQNLGGGAERRRPEDEIPPHW